MPVNKQKYISEVRRSIKSLKAAMNGYYSLDPSQTNPKVRQAFSELYTDLENRVEEMLNDTGMLQVSLKDLEAAPRNVVNKEIYKSLAHIMALSPSDRRQIAGLSSKKIRELEREARKRGYLGR